MAIEIVDLPINSMVIFYSHVNVYQRVTIIYPIKIPLKYHKIILNTIKIP